MSKYLKKLANIFLAVAVAGLAGCAKDKVAEPNNLQTPPVEETQRAKAENILKSKSVLVVRQNNNLVLVNPETKETSTIYQLQENEIPLTNELFDFQVTSDNQWVVWYSARKGLTVLNIETRETALLTEATEWLKRNPYFELDDEKPIVYWIGNNGSVLNEFDLKAGKKIEIPIPYPFGNIFRVSPDNQRFLYITGYSNVNIEKTRPRFMFSDRNGNLETTFASDIELSNRFTVEWRPDSSGIVTIYDDNVWFYPYSDPEKPELFVKMEGAGARDIKRSGEDVFILDSVGYWHKYDFATGKEKARIPVDIAQELRKPQFYPWNNQMLLISETSQEEQNKFHRLWLSNYRGQKEMVLAQFGEAQVATFSVQID